MVGCQPIRNFLTMKKLIPLLLCLAAPLYSQLTYTDLPSTSDIDIVTPTVTSLNEAKTAIDANTTAIATKQDADGLLDDIAALTDPDADRLLFWDDSAGDFTFLSVGSGLSLSGTTLSASGGGFDSTAIDATTWSDGTNGSNVWTFDVSGTDPTITFGDGTITFGGDLAMGSNDITGIGSMTISGTLAAGSLTIGGESAAVASDLAIDASGFDGNLTSTDDTIQELAQAVDDLVLGSGSGDTVVSSWPSPPTAQTWYYNTTAKTRRYYPTTAETMYHESSAYTYVDSVAPTVSAVAVDGTDATITWSKPAYTGASWATTEINFDMSTTGSDIAVSSLDSGDGTATWDLTLASAAVYGETVDMDLLGSADGIENAAGTDVAAASDISVTNETAGAVASASDDFESYALAASLGDQSNWTALLNNGSIEDDSGNNVVSGTASVSDNVLTYTGETWAENQQAQVDFVVVTNNSGVVARAQAGPSYYSATVNDLGLVTLAKVISGSYTSLSSQSMGAAIDGDEKIRLSVTGSGAATRIQVEFHDGTSWATVTGMSAVDPGDYLSGGDVGVISYRNLDQIDNFSATDL